jgi:poly-beta-1,6-N-acetyl-D-glucosamine synthase
LIIVNLISLLYCFLLFLYVLFVIYLFFNWLKIEIFHFKKSNSVCLSLIIPVKNKAESLPFLFQSILRQNLDKNRFEVIFIDDHSSDLSKILVENFLEVNSNAFQLNLISASNNGKKNAILEGIKLSKNNLIVCTDADCRFDANFLERYASFFEKKKPFFVFGAVVFEPFEVKKNNYFENCFNELQRIEFSSLVGSGAACWKAGFPNMCNGANLAFDKSVFFDVGGYEGNEHILSGDDEFLMHKMYLKYPERVFFIKSKDAVVQTTPNQSWKEFHQQRLRWASKWENYTDWKVKGVAFYIFFTNLGQVLLILGLLTGKLNITIEACIVILLHVRWILEYGFLKSVLRFMNKKLNLLSFIFLILVYPVYVVYFAIIPRLYNLNILKNDRK